MAKVTITIECENINTLREIGYIKIVPKLSASAESVYFSQFRKPFNYHECIKHIECVECPDFCSCNHIDGE